jgi:shikimate dehydrogenase
VKTVLIGFPLAHSITPAMYAPAFEAMRLQVQCEKWVTPPGELALTVQRLRAPNILGANVTVPHKEAVIPLLDEVDTSAGSIGAVNCIVRLEGGRLRGYNTDKYGFVRSLLEAGFEPRGKRVLLLGAGGAARAVALGLIESDVAALTIANRTRERAEALSRSLGEALAMREVVDWHSPAFDSACARADLVVNSTPMGTAHTDLASLSPLEARHFHAGQLAYDLVYNPPVTPFLALAAEAGAQAVSGLEMLVYQGAESIRLFSGHEPSVDIMRQAAQKALV